MPRTVSENCTQHKSHINRSRVPGQDRAGSLQPVNVGLHFWRAGMEPAVTALPQHLVFRSGFLAGLLGVLLMIGCMGYLIDSVTHFLLLDFGMTFSELTFVGELLLPLWLVIKGVDVKSWGTLAHSNRSFEYTSQNLRGYMKFYHYLIPGVTPILVSGVNWTPRSDCFFASLPSLSNKTPRG